MHERINPRDLGGKEAEEGELESAKFSEQESDEVTENLALGRVPLPEGDDAGENRVATSISED